MYFEDSLHPKKLTSKSHIPEYDYSKMIVSSGLLNEYYKSSMTAGVKFLDSVRNIKKYIAMLDKDVDEQQLIYVDLPADNKIILRDYLEMLRSICKRKLRNIIILPIPCIEYYMLLAFGKLDKEDFKILTMRGLYKDTCTYQNNMSKTFCSFEKYCKVLVSKYFPHEYQGSKEIEVIEEMFRNGDSERLLYRLPIFLCYLKNMPNVHEVNSSDIELKLFNTFLDQLYLYKNNGYIDIAYNANENNDTSLTICDIKLAHEQYRALICG